MSFYRIKRVRGREYVYEMESYRNEAGKPRSRTIRYVGPVAPVPAPARVDIAALREAKAARGGAEPDGKMDKSPEERRQERTEQGEEARNDRRLRATRW